MATENPSSSWRALRRLDLGKQGGVLRPGDKVEMTAEEAEKHNAVNHRSRRVLEPWTVTVSEEASSADDEQLLRTAQAAFEALTGTKPGRRKLSTILEEIRAASENVKASEE